MTTSLARIAATLLATSIASAAAAGETIRAPSGTYCGALSSAGVLSDAQTHFETDASGTIIGKYVFSDQGQPVPGELAETGDDGDGSDLTRTFMWRDKYGYGQLIVTFTPNFSEFEGKWNAGGSEFLPWNGRWCQQTIS
ncbi:hypothetical protein PWG15_10195 [Ensifer adhaerens]|uniref:hypothetical protein n=1 Tax=Ensifer adhaerens TaxID=106592 RepID=UPI0023A9DFE8|nr:hypothetical protein [Ensifer adhaerens]WDZ78826.1 hypothetical protein PWG15_10195 [Ensifer adhaerens]